MPLKSAVRKLRKTFHQLHPCINYTMPDNIHVYDPKDLVIVTEGMYSNTIVSQPNLRALSKHNLREEKQRRTNSEINLKAVRTQSVESIPAVVVDVPEEPDDMEDVLREISIMDDSKGASGLSRSDSNMTIVQMGEASLPGSTDDELEEVTIMKPRHKFSRSSPDVTVIDIKESAETSFTNCKPNRLKLSRPSTPTKNEVESVEIKVEAVPRSLQSVKPKVREPTPKQAADDLQQVTVETPKRTVQRKGKEQLAFIELEDLEEQRKRRRQVNPRNQRSPSPSGRVSAPAMRVTRAVSPPIRLSVPEIRVISTDEETSEPTAVAAVDKEHTSGQNHLYQKRKTPEGPKPGRVVDLRLKNDGPDIGKDESERSRRKSSSAHEEELSIEQKVASDKTKAGYSEVSELDSRYDKVADARKTSRECANEADNHKKHQTGSDSGNHNGSKSPKPAQGAVGNRQYASQDPHQRTRSPKPLNQETTFTIRQQKFPKTLTQGMMHTELNSVSSSSGKVSPESTRKNHSKSPDTMQQVHYVSETPDKSPRLSKHKKQSTEKEQIIKGPSQKVGSGEAGVTELILDPALMATPEFKLKAFQRTSKDPHPSTPFLHKTESKAGLNDTQLERIDPFFVPGTPLQSPVSQLVSPTQVKAHRDRSPSPETRGRHIGSKRRERSRSPGGVGRIVVSHGEKNNNGLQGKTDVTPIQNPAVTKLKQGWL